MSALTTVERLRVLLPHWIEHNRGHGEEFTRWTAELENAEIVEALEQARAALEQAETHLRRALDAAGGPLEGGQDGHVHGHGGHHHHHESA